ncbi:MAG: ATP-binding protein [Deltaproteobacteria bacterium]|nr:ATP-binding protein [Deltaproteobacteria bacterium]
MRRFNTAGPCDAIRHYLVPPEPRLPEARGLVAQGAYFVVHAPRQTGKTTTLWALARALCAEGSTAALHFSCETGESAGDDLVMAQGAVLDSIRRQAEIDLPPELRPPARWPDASPAQLLSAALTSWARSCPRPLVLFFDEIDALRGESLRAVLRQLRAGYQSRPAAFPAAVALCGLRDVRDYKAASGGDPSRLGTSSPFNIKLKSVRLGDFTATDLRALYGQHTAETGQPFTEEALARAWELTQGQPWLVNALAREVVEEIGVAPPATIKAEHLEEAKERLILARQTHLDSLAARLMEPRVRRILEPIMAGTLQGGDAYDDDAQYVRDLGLVAPDRPLRVANPIYREVIARVLSVAVEDNLDLEPQRFVLGDGQLDLRLLLEEFAAFWREHGEVLGQGLPYHEVAPQLVLMAFLQRVVNGGGYIDREYGGVGGRIDLLVRWPFRAAGGGREWQREALELKVWAAGKPDPLGRGLEQLEAYLERLGLGHGVLVIFDRRPEAGPIEGRTHFAEARTAGGREVTVLRA